MSITLLYQELTTGAYRAFRALIPEPQNRTPLTWKAIPYNLIAFVPFLFMCHLVRRPGTRIMRLLLLPIVVTIALATAFRFSWTDPTLNGYNWGQCLYAEFVIVKAIEFAFTKEGRFKIGEIIPGVMKKPQESHQNLGLTMFLPKWFQDAMDAMCSLRGLGFDFGRGVHIPPETKSLERKPFLTATFSSFLQNYVLLDFLESAIKLFPGVGSVRGGSIFYEWLPPFQRYTVSTFIHFMSGTALVFGFGMVYDMLTLIGVAVFHNAPSSWPPILDNPWISDSMHIFWAKRWHQLLRRTFLVFGGIPGFYLAGNLGLIMGAFVASGLFHEMAIYSMGHGFDRRVLIFFALQGPILVFERLWRRIIGQRVGGRLGMVWVYFCLVVLGQPLVDAWHSRGLAGAMIIPPSLSPTRRLLWPLLRYISNIQSTQ